MGRTKWKCLPGPSYVFFPIDEKFKFYKSIKT